MASPFAGRDKFRVFNHGTISFFAGAMCLALSGCYSATGDFGRPQQGVWENSILPTMGILAATARGEPASWYALTEDEKELRARAWNFLMPETDAPVNFTSLTSRYNRVRDVITADHALVPHFKLISAQVVQADHVRARSLGHVANLTEVQHEQAIRRICENALIIARVHWAYHDRAGQYRYSLEHLLVEGPEREAIPAERALMAFEADISRFRKDTVLPPVCTAPVALPEPLVPRPLVRKG